MSGSTLLDDLNAAIAIKPAFGESCNHCGFCCLMEPCITGQAITGKKYGPCGLLVSEGGLHKCSLVVTDENNVMVESLGIGAGCCAETQEETMARVASEFEL